MAEPVPTSAPGQQELLKKYKLHRHAEENLNLSCPGLSGQTFAQGNGPTSLVVQ